MNSDFKKFKDDFQKFEIETHYLFDLIKLLSYLHFEFLEDDNFPNGNKKCAKLMLLSLAHAIEKSIENQNEEFDKISSFVEQIPTA